MFKKYKSPGTDQILTELIQAGGEALQSEIHKLIDSISNKEELPDQCKEPIIVPVYKKGDKTGCSTINLKRAYDSVRKYCTIFS
jgi:hypothetical protein